VDRITHILGTKITPMKGIAPISFMINNGFRINSEISKMVDELFDLDEYASVILEEIAENGPLTAYQIKIKGNKKVEKVTREKVKYRLEGKLKDFLIVVKGDKHRNTGKIKKYYYLTLKGLIASLSTTSFEENYIIKKYLEFLVQWANKYHIPEITIQLIKYNLALYLIKNVIDGSKLTDLSNIEAKIFKLNSHESLTEPYLRQKPIANKKLEKIEFKIRIRLHIIQQILTQAINNVSLEHISDTSKLQQNKKNLSPVDNFILNILSGYIKHWFDYIHEIQFEKIDGFKPVTTLDDRYSHGIQINIKDANRDAHTILKKIGIKAQFTDSKVPSFFF